MAGHSNTLIIYECATCGWWFGDEVPREERGPHPIVCDEGLAGEGHPPEAMREVRVFREDDVRPLWDALRAQLAYGPQTAKSLAALRDFPAPEGW